MINGKTWYERTRNNVAYKDRSISYVERLEAYAFALTKAFTSATCGGGSEMFLGQLKDDDGDETFFMADIAFCMERNLERRKRDHRLAIEGIANALVSPARKMGLSGE